MFGKFQRLAQEKEQKLTMDLFNEILEECIDFKRAYLEKDPEGNKSDLMLREKEIQVSEVKGTNIMAESGERHALPGIDDSIGLREVEKKTISESQNVLSIEWFVLWSYRKCRKGRN